MAASKCTICGKETRERCNTCKAAYYCSLQCQRMDRPLHRILCSGFQAFLQTRPVPQDEDKESTDVLPVAYKAAFLFPVESKNPELIWLRVHISSMFCLGEKKEVAWYHFREDVDATQYMGHPKGMPHKRDGRELKVSMGDNAFQGPLTKSLLRLNAGYKNNEPGAFAGAPWAGNIVVVNVTTRKVRYRDSYETIEEEEDTSDDEEQSDAEYDEKEKHNDVTLSDFRYAFDFLTRENYIFESKTENKFVVRKPGQWFNAVKVHCDGDVKFESKQKYTEVVISRRHPVFLKPSGQSSISKHLGFPLLLMRLKPNPQWEVERAKLPKNERRALGTGENAETSCLMIEVDLNSRNWRYAPRVWDKGMDYTCVVARKDMKDITAHQVEALCNYSRYVISERMGRIYGIGMFRDGDIGSDSDLDEKLDDMDKHYPTQRTRQLFLDQYLLSDKFANYFEEYKQEKLSEGDATWSNETLPVQGSVPEEIALTEEERDEAYVRMMEMTNMVVDPDEEAFLRRWDEICKSLRG